MVIIKSTRILNFVKNSIRSVVVFTGISINYCADNEAFNKQLLNTALRQVHLSKYVAFDANKDYIANNINTPLLTYNTELMTVKRYNIKIKPTNITNSLITNNRLLSNNIKLINIPWKQLSLNKTKLLKNKQQVKIHSRPVSLNNTIARMESKYNLPSRLLMTIGTVESKLKSNVINYNGRGYYFNKVEEAVKFANNLIRKGITNFSVGCFQLHYQSHHNKFKSVSDMFDPARNAEYAAKLLKNLHKRNGNDWANAIKQYHSNNPYSNNRYYSKVVKYLGRKI